MSEQSHPVTGMLSAPRTENIYAFEVDGAMTYVFSHGETVWHVPAEDLDTALRAARANAQGGERRRPAPDSTKGAKP